MTPKKVEAAAELEHHPSTHGGAYEIDAEGKAKKLEGPRPDYGWLDDGKGNRVRAGADGKPVKEQADV